MDLTRILVAVNSPIGPDAAFDRALTLAQSSGAELYLLHAVPANRPFARSAPERLQRMTELRRRAADAGVRVETVEQHGDAPEMIELHAKARGASLIVMGGEARRDSGRWSSWLDRLVSGSTLRRLLRRTTVPVLVVPVLSGADEWTTDRPSSVAVPFVEHRALPQRDACEV